MARGYSRQIYTHGNGALTTATAQVIIGPIDVSEFEKFCLVFQNNHTAGGINDLKLEAALDASANVDNGSGAPNWVAVGTANIPYPSSLAATATTLTSAIDNCYNYIRIRGGISTTAAGQFRLLIGGFTRKG